MTPNNAPPREPPEARIAAHVARWIPPDLRSLPKARLLELAVAAHELADKIHAELEKRSSPNA